MNIKHLLTAALVCTATLATAQLKVGNNPTSINANSVLEAESTNKGLLLPRVALTGTANVAPLAAHVAGMTVYNTATAGNVTPGYYYNTGAAWVRLAGEGAASTEPWFNVATNAAATANTQNIYQLGNVGVGTATPNAPLQLSNALANRKIVLFEGANNDHEYFGFGLNANTLRYQTQGIGAAHRFYTATSSSASTELMSVLGNGNVGIGVTAPNAPLQISNNSGLNNRKIVLFEDVNNEHQFYGFGINNSTLRYQISAPGASHVFMTGNGSGASIELMRILGTGNVGIGVNAPIRPLDVQGSMQLRNPNNAGAPLVFQPGGTATNSRLFVANGAIELQSNEGTATTPIIKVNHNGADRMTILANGNVGVGITAPNAPLQISNVINNRKIVLFEDANNEHQFYGFGINSAALRYQISAPGASHVFMTGNGSGASTELMRILGTGNVGIGVNAPIRPLDVQGTMQLRNPNNAGAPLVFQPGGTATNSRLFVANGAIELQSNEVTATTPIIKVINGGADKMTILANGNVSIGSTTPRAKLSVEGGHISVASGSNFPIDANMFAMGWNGINIGAGEVDLANYSGTGAGQSFRFHRIGGTGIASNVTVISTIDAAGNYAVVSDARVKSNIQGIGYGLKQILALNPVSYNRHITPKLENGRVTYTDKGVVNVGFLAQEVYKVIPEAAIKPADDKKELWGVIPSEMIPVLVKAIQEQQVQIEELKAQIKSLINKK
jgi:hypothetical protein